MKKRLPILDIWVDPLTREEAAGRVREMLESGSRPQAVFAANPEKNFSVPRNPALYDAYKSADILLPDGIGIVLAARLLHGARIRRIPGAEFCFDICEAAVATGSPVFVYGAKEAVNRAAAARLRERYPGLVLAGRSDGYVPEEKMPQLVDAINRSGAKVLFLALGSPRQELWFARHKDDLENIRVCQGIGGTLDTIAGTVRRAPEVWRRSNLEWLYRLLKEPRRIRRQKVLPLFAARVARQWARGFFRGGAVNRATGA